MSRKKKEKKSSAQKSHVIIFFEVMFNRRLGGCITYSIRVRATNRKNKDVNVATVSITAIQSSRTPGTISIQYLSSRRPISSFKNL